MKKTLLVFFSLMISAVLIGNSIAEFDFSNLSIEDLHKFKNETFSLNLQREITMEILYQEWQENTWVNESKAIYSADENNFIIEMLSVNWVDEAWVNTMKLTMTNNSEGLPIETLYQMWEPNSSYWYDVALMQMSYDASDNMTVMLIQMWFGTEWMNSSRYSITYNDDNNPSYELLEEWDFDDGLGWINDDQLTYSYSGLFLEEIFEEDWENEAWINSQLISYVLAGNYHPAERTKQSWNGGGFWSNTRYSVYTYDDDWNEIEDYEQEWTDGAWLNFQTHYYTYEDGFLMERLTHDWSVDREWVNGSRDTYTYGTSSAENDVVANNFGLQNFPNPFNPSTTINFNTLGLEDSDNCNLEIYNLKGQRIKKFANIGNLESIFWDGTDEKKRAVPTGIYLYKLSIGSRQQSRKMLLIK